MIPQIRQVRCHQLVHPPYADRATGRAATVYNFEVEDARGYYVEAGEHWIFVDSDCGQTVAEALQGRVGSIQRAPLPRGVPP